MDIDVVFDLCDGENQSNCVLECGCRKNWSQT